MTALYVETSALVRALVGSDTAVASAMREATDLVTSALTGLEAARAIARLRRDGHLSPAGERDSLRRLAEFERSAGTRSIDDEVLRAARREFPVEPDQTSSNPSRCLARDSSAAHFPSDSAAVITTLQDALCPGVRGRSASRTRSSGLASPPGADRGAGARRGHGEAPTRR